MWCVGLPMICRRNLINRTTRIQCFNLISVNLSVVDSGSLSSLAYTAPNSYYSSQYLSNATSQYSVDSGALKSNNNNENNIDKMSLASNLAACLVEESCSIINETKPLTRLELKRFHEFRIKKRVKEQFKDGKFHDLIEKVIANPYTLQDAYGSIRVNSKVNSSSERDDIHFDSIAEQLSSGNFDINSNIYYISTKGGGANKETLVLPNLKLNIIQEAIRIVLEVVYKPHYSKISHGCRSGRGQSSAYKYICSKEIDNPDWWFTLVLNKKIDGFILTKLISTMESKIEDPKLYNIIKKMFDAGSLNLEFGGFAKGHGLPQEGVLSPILMNIYLDIFDSEFHNMSMKYEVLDDGQQYDESKSKLRSWFRRQTSQRNEGNMSGKRVYCCRFMDEILIIVKGSKEMSVALKSEIETYMRESLYLEMDSNQTGILSCNDDSRGAKFVGNFVKRTVKESPAVKAVHKLKEKVELFALQKQQAWDEGTVRIGKKCLGHGFKKVKESEIKHLADCNSVLSQVSRFRKPGMETDHWYKVLLKIWMQDKNVKYETEELILSKFITENALPQELKDSFYTFQNHAKNYISSETKSTLDLLPESSEKSASVTEVLAPINAIRMCLRRYGIINSQGYPCACHMLVLLDHDHIIDWFYGLVYRWIKWYRLCGNFIEIKLNISNQVRKSCIRTLATKYRLHESEIERKFDLDLSRIPLTTEDFENDFLNENLEFYDEGLLYGICYSGVCLLSLARIVSESRPCTCFVIGCRDAAPCVYTIHVMQRQKFPVWKTGFSSCIHPSIHGRRIGLCNQHLKDLFIGHISLQSISFGDWK